MEPSDKQLLIERIIQSLFLIIGIGILIWLAPNWIPQLSSHTIVNQSQRYPQNLQIQKYLTREPHNEDIYNGVHFITYLLSNPIEYAQEIHEALDATQIENYLLSVDQLDFELFIYQNGNLSHRILFIQEMNDITIPANTNPMIAVVIGGLGETNSQSILHHPIPLSLAFVPSAPFTLPMAYEGGRKWHEILIDMRNTPGVNQPEQIIPFLSGSLSNEPISIESLQFISVYPYAKKHEYSKNSVPLYARKHIDIHTLIIRAKKMALQKGFCGILIEATDPNLPVLLNWTTKAKEEGIHLIMVSELGYRSPIKDKPIPTKPEQ